MLLGGKKPQTPGSAYSHAGCIVWPFSINTSLYVIALIVCIFIFIFFLSLKKALDGEVLLKARCAVKGTVMVWPEKHPLYNCYLRSEH